MRFHHAGSAIFIGATLLLSGCSGGDSSTSTSTSTSSTEAKITPNKKAQASDYSNAVQELYIAYFGRPADPGGLTNFENSLLLAGAPTTLAGLNAAYGTNKAVKTLIDSFGTSAESIALYGSGDTTAFVTAIYQNVLSRAPDSGGLAFWQSAIDNSGLTKGNAALSIMAGALTNTTAQGQLDGELVVNKVAVSGEFSTAAAADNNVYSGNAAAASARTMLGTVTSTTVPSAFQSTINSTLSSIAAQEAANPTATVLTLAGMQGVAGHTDGTGSAASFYNPVGIAADNQGNVYVSDNGTVIRKITPAGVVTTLAGLAHTAGHADGTGIAASFNSPGGLAVDSQGNVFVADTGNSLIRKITPAGVVTTFAGTALVRGSANGTGTAASFSLPAGLAIDSQNNLYVGDTKNNSIRKISPTGVVTTLAGTAGVAGSANGTGSAASFSNPEGLAVDSAGNVYVADTYNNTIRKVSPVGVVTTLAGTAGVVGLVNGTGSEAAFHSPTSVATDSAGNVYVADSVNNEIRRITPAGIVTILAGSATGALGYADGIGTAASFFIPEGVAINAVGNMYVSDTSNYTIRQITFK